MIAMVERINSNILFIKKITLDYKIRVWDTILKSTNIEQIVSQTGAE